MKDNNNYDPISDKTTIDEYFLQLQQRENSLLTPSGNDFVTELKEAYEEYSKIVGSRN